MACLVAHRTKFSVKYDTLTDVILYICLCSLVPFTGAIAIDTDV